MNLTKIEKVFIGFFLLVIIGFIVYEFVPFGTLFDDSKKEEVVVEKTSDEKVVEEKAVDKISEEEIDVNGEKVARGVDEKNESTVKKIVTEKVAKSEEKTDEELIKSYYGKLASQDLEGAYKMKYDTKKVTFAQFKSWYQNVLFADVTDIVKKGDGSYQFTVYLREKNSVEEKYLVTMEVKDELLNTISSEKTWDNYTPEFYTDVNNKIRTLYIKKGGVEKVVATVDENQYKYVYSDYKISSNNKYLMYTILGDGWGYRAIHVYDIDAGREVNLLYSQTYDFTPDYKYFYQCNGMGESAGEFTVFTVPGFKKIYSGGEDIVDCKGYNQDMNAYFLVTGWNENIPKTYDFATNTLK